MKNQHAIAGLAFAAFFLLAAARTAASPMDALASEKNFTAHRVSSHDPTGGNADGSHGNPLMPGDVRVLADIGGPGEITHIWATIASDEPGHLRKLVLRMYWDGEENPSVEAPIGDFFGLGHGQYYQYDSLPIQIGEKKGLNAFWRMPFSKSAKITLTNEGDYFTRLFYYYVDYRVFGADPGEKMRYHSQYRQDFPPPTGENYVFMEAEGKGHYVGVNLSMELTRDGWWGEGDDMFFVDGEAEPSLYGTGSEDYFGGAWGYGEPFSDMYLGNPLRGDDKTGGLWNVYRYHVEDPIPFTQSIRATIEHGTENNRFDNFSSTAYWYQEEPHKPFPPLPAASERMPEMANLYKQPGGFEEFEELTADVKDSSGDQFVYQKMKGGTDGETWSMGAVALFKADAKGDFVAFEEEIPTDLLATLELYAVMGPDYGVWQLKVNSEAVGKPFNGYSPTLQRKKITLKNAALYTGKTRIEMEILGKSKESSGYLAAIDCGRITPMGAPPPKK